MCSQVRTTPYMGESNLPDADSTWARAHDRVREIRIGYGDAGMTIEAYGRRRTVQFTNFF